MLVVVEVEVVSEVSVGSVELSQVLKLVTKNLDVARLETCSPFTAPADGAAIAPNMDATLHSKTLVTIKTFIKKKIVPRIEPCGTGVHVSHNYFNAF